MDARPKLELKIGVLDAPEHAHVARQRLFGRWRPRLFRLAILSLFWLVIAVSILLALAAGGGWPSIAVMVSGGTVALGVHRASTKLAIGRMEQRLLDREIPERLEWTASTDDEGFRLRSEMGEMAIRWFAVQEVFLFEDHWIVLYYRNVFGIPRRAFPSLDHEIAFMQAVMERLGPAARTRSRSCQEAIARLTAGVRDPG